jgi:hypothetical protein
MLRVALEHTNPTIPLTHFQRMKHTNIFSVWSYRAQWFTMTSCCTKKSPLWVSQAWNMGIASRKWPHECKLIRLLHEEMTHSRGWEIDCQSPKCKNILESRHHRKRVMVEGPPSLHELARSTTSPLLPQRYATETHQYWSIHDRLVVTETGHEWYLRIIMGLGMFSQRLDWPINGFHCIHVGSNASLDLSWRHASPACKYHTQQYIIKDPPDTLNTNQEWWSRSRGCQSRTAILRSRCSIRTNKHPKRHRTIRAGWWSSRQPWSTISVPSGGITTFPVQMVT